MMVGVLVIKTPEGLFPNYGYIARAEFITRSCDYLQGLWRFNELALGSRNVSDGRLLH